MTRRMTKVDAIGRSSTYRWSRRGSDPARTDRVPESDVVQISVAEGETVAAQQRWDSEGGAGGR